MDSKMLTLGRAKKKLRYIQTEDNTPCAMKIQNVFSLNCLDNIFDDLDSASDSLTPQLSPLSRGDELMKQDRGDCWPDLGPASPTGAEEQEVLAPERGIQGDHLNEKESPFKEIAPIKTSSPIDILPVGAEAGDTERSEITPLLFGVEDEEPVGGDLSKPPSNQRSESPKEFLQEDSDSLASPPARLEFGKSARKGAASVKSCVSVKNPAVPPQESQTSAPETREESQMDGSPRLLPSILVQDNPPESLSKEQPKNQVPEVKLDVEIKKSSFQKKLRDTLQPKSSWKKEAKTQQARAPSPLELEDDFMILEDDAPILFRIPRKTVVSQKEIHAPEEVSAKPDSKTAASPVKTVSSKPGDDGKKQIDEPDATKTKKTRAKRGKTFDKFDKDTVTQATQEERTDPLTETVEAVPVCESPSVPEASQNANIPVKQKRGSKTSKSEKPGKKEGQEDNQAEIPVGKPASKLKKAAKLTGGDSNGQEETASNVKKKLKKAKSPVKVGARMGQALGSAKPSKQSIVNGTLTNKQVPEEQEQVDELHSNTEPPPEPTEEDVQSTAAVKKSDKQPATKQGTSKRALKVKKIEKTKQDPKIKELPVPEPSVSAEGPVTGRRKRKPPGEWWINSDGQNEGNTQKLGMADPQSLQEPKLNKKQKRKEAPAISKQSTEEQQSQGEPNKPVTVQKGAKKKNDLKNPKTARGRQKPKSAVPAQHETQSKTASPADGEEVTVNENVVHFSPPPRRRCLTPGDKRVFNQIYRRDSECGSAQKHPPSLLSQPKNRPGKRQRKAPGSWWEVPQSQGSFESSPMNCSPQKSKPQMAAPSSALNKVAGVVRLQKTGVHTQKRNKINMLQTPKSVKTSLATFNALQASGRPASSLVKGQGSRRMGRNLLHSLEDQSEQSSENIHSDQQYGAMDATFDVCTSGVTVEPLAASKRIDVRLSAGSNRASGHDFGFKSGPSSMIELEHFEEHEDSDLLSSGIIHHTQQIPRVLLDCDICGPPLQPIVLETEDWNNLCSWFADFWPSSSKEGQTYSVINPDDFHWHSYSGRAMGHMVDFQTNTYSNGKILLGSYMKKPPKLDLHAVTVFNVASSCVWVEIDGVKAVYNCGQTFMTPCGQAYSIHNMGRKPAVLWYHRMLPDHLKN